MADNIAGDKRSEEQIFQDSLFLWTVLESLDHPFMVIDAEDYSVLLANSAARFSMSREVKTCYGLSHGRNTPCDARQPARHRVKPRPPAAAVEFVPESGATPPGLACVQ